MAGLTASRHGGSTFKGIPTRESSSPTGNARSGAVLPRVRNGRALWVTWRKIEPKLDYAALRSSPTAVVILEAQPDG